MARLVQAGNVVVVLSEDASLVVVVLDLVTGREVAVYLARPAVVAVARECALVVVRVCAEKDKGAGWCLDGAGGVRCMAGGGEGMAVALERARLAVRVWVSWGRTASKTCLLYAGRYVKRLADALQQPLSGRRSWEHAGCVEIQWIRAECGGGCTFAPVVACVVLLNSARARILLLLLF